MTFGFTGRGTLHRNRYCFGYNDIETNISTGPVPTDSDAVQALFIFNYSRDIVLMSALKTGLGLTYTNGRYRIRTCDLTGVIRAL